jgi:GxxExxY protein
MEANEITYLIRGAAFRVHTAPGPGLLESVYEAALKYELQRDGLRVRIQVGIPMIYGEIRFDPVFRLD